MQNGYRGVERRHSFQLSDEQFESISKRAAELAAPKAAELGKKDIYAEIGQGVFRRILWLLGLGGSGLVAYLATKGYIK